jgi:RHS repeat-associated protein
VPDDDTCTPQDSAFVWTQTGAGTQLEQETTSGPFAGMVRYTFAGGIDDALALWKEDGSGTFGLVPHRSWRGLYEAGSSIGPRAVGAQWPGQNRDAFFADDARVQPIEPTQWLGGIVDGKRDQSGLMYMRNRYYDPSTGRFTQEDPLGLAGGMNLYGFAGGDPVNFSDPFGLCANPTAMGLGSLQCLLEDALAGAKAMFGRAKQGVADHLAESGRRAAACFSNPVCAALSFSGDGAEVEGISEKIGAGHAFAKHVVAEGQFKDLGISTQAQLQGFVQGIMQNAAGADVRTLSKGRTGYWDAATGSVVIHDPRNADLGTVFRPTNGRQYFDNLK